MQDDNYYIQAILYHEKNLLITTLLLFLWACSDGLALINNPQSLSDTFEILKLDATDGYYSFAIEGDKVRKIAIVKGDFINDLGNGSIYYEQNDNYNGTRYAEILVNYVSGRDSLFIIEQPRVTRAEVSNGLQFYRHYGLGYSYDAVNGKYCNRNDFRCQIFNRVMLDSASIKEGEYYVTPRPMNFIIDSESQLYTSIVDYVQNTNFSADASAELIVFNGEIQAACSAFEDGIIETYIISHTESHSVAEYRLYDGIKNVVGKYPQILTSSFRTAVDNLSDIASLDNFISTYGTHVVTHVKLGARLSLDIQVETKKFETIENKDLLLDAEIDYLFKVSKQKKEEEKNYQILKNTNCILDVKGGDVSIFDPIINLGNKFDPDQVSDEMLYNWRKSLPNNESELVDKAVDIFEMDVTPIWHFIDDKEKSEMVYNFVKRDITKIISKLDNRNFLSTNFEAHPKSVKCRIGNEIEEFNNPETVEVIAANRHVATICKEYVPNITTKEKVYVAYPIYEGRIKMQEGLCLYDGCVYRVKWNNCKFSTEILNEDIIDDKIYMNYGSLSAQPKDIDYQASHLILGCERPGGIGINGELSGEMCKIYKHFGHFYLDNKNKYDNLPGWSYSDCLPEEANNYKDYFPNDTYSNRMVRNDDYIYQLNSTEVGYVK